MFGRGYWELQRHAYLFCAPTEVGGTHLVILEAMAAGNCVLVNDHRPNSETVGDAGIYFSGKAGVDDLVVQLRRLLTNPALVADYRSRAAARAHDYSWEAVTDQYEQLLMAVRDARGPGPLPEVMLDRELVAAAKTSTHPGVLGRSGCSGRRESR